MTLSFPISKSFYKADNLFKHDFLERQSFDTVDILWYRTHEPIEGFGDQRIRSLDDTELNKINRTIDSCPDNELESYFNQILQQLTELQQENEIFDFYFEFYYVNLDESIKDELALQKRSDIIHELRIIESDELSSDYVLFWNYVYEKSSLKAIISPIIWDNSNLTTIQSSNKKGTTNKSKVPSDSSDVTIGKNKEFVKQIKYDESSLMNARFLLQQIKDKGLDEDRLTYVNIFAEDDDEDNVDEDYSTPSSATLSAEGESLEPSASRLTEISFEKETAIESDTGMKDPFKDRSFDSLYYVARLIYGHLVNSSNIYFTEAPVILLENDLVIEMKERESNYLNHCNKTVNQYLVKIIDKDGVEGFNGRLFRRGLLRITEELVRKMEGIKQEGVLTANKTKQYADFTYSILRSPKVELSDYRRLVNFDSKTEEIKRQGQNRKIKQFKTMVCLAGRTKLRRYDYSEIITQKLNGMKFPMYKIANLTHSAREHATSTVSGYLDTLLRLIRKRKFFEDYPEDMYARLHNTVNKTYEVIKNLEELKVDCAEAKKMFAARSIYKPLGYVRTINDTIGQVNLIKNIQSKTATKESEITTYDLKNCKEIPSFTSGLNIILEKEDSQDKLFKKTVLPSILNKAEIINEITPEQPNCYQMHGFPEEYSRIMQRYVKKK